MWPQRLKKSKSCGVEGREGDIKHQNIIEKNIETVPVLVPFGSLNLRDPLKRLGGPCGALSASVGSLLCACCQKKKRDNVLVFF